MNFFFRLFQRSNGSGHRVRLVLLFTSAIYVLAMLALGYAWYSPQWISSFHLFNDLPEWKQMDKFAHFFWTFQVSVLASRLMAWATVSDHRVPIYGAGLGFIFVSGIEIADGFSLAYGASLYDIAANGLGAAAFVGQRRLWKQILIWPKFSFHPTAFAPLRPEVLGDGLLEEVLKDYNGQTFWYSFNIPKLPLPRWLTPAIGVGAEGMVHGRDAENELINLDPHRRYFLSVDINLSHIQTNSRIGNTLLYVLNIVKFPAPALEISTAGIRFHPIYF